MQMEGADLFNLRLDASPTVTPSDHYPLWIESIWRDDDGTIYAWYHHEVPSQCGGKLTAPKIGALISHDGGESFTDLGIVLSSPYPINCNAQNGFFGSGHGDFSVILDQNREFFYFLFTNYGGPASSQGVAMARMAFADRAAPVGAVYKFHQLEWDEAGNGGEVTPIFPARVSWDRSNADSYWGPAVHWNTFLNSYVVVMNRACCKTNWPQEGIYLTFNADLSKPWDWSAPAKILDDADIGFAPGYYPQIFGTEEGESDTLAGKTARLFVKGVSKWQITFREADPPDPDDGEPEPEWPGGGGVSHSLKVKVILN